MANSKAHMFFEDQTWQDLIHWEESDTSKSKDDEDLFIDYYLQEGENAVPLDMNDLQSCTPASKYVDPMQMLVEQSDDPLSLTEPLLSQSGSDIPRNHSENSLCYKELVLMVRELQRR